MHGISLQKYVHFPVQAVVNGTAEDLRTIVVRKLHQFWKKKKIYKVLNGIRKKDVKSSRFYEVSLGRHIGKMAAEA
jgi:hypothetical protein